MQWRFYPIMRFGQLVKIALLAIVTFSMAMNRQRNIILKAVEDT